MIDCSFSTTNLTFNKSSLLAEDDDIRMFLVLKMRATLGDRNNISGFTSCIKVPFPLDQGRSQGGGETCRAPYKITREPDDF